MSRLIITGGERLHGEMQLHGAKNSALPILAASLICEGESVIHNCPRLTDVDASLKILTHLGCVCRREGDTVIVDASEVTGSEIPDELMREMRSSIMFLGAIVARTGRATASFPGGCELGPRPIDLHLDALRRLGLSIDEDHGYLACNAGEGLTGCEIDLAIPSVGATENIMLAASTAAGKTVIRNAAREPEISDLADYLNRCGAKVYGAGSSTVEIEGVPHLHGAEHTVIPDRIAAATYMAAAAVTRGHVTLHGVNMAHLRPVLPMFAESGCEVTAWERSLTITAPPRLSRMRMVTTHEFPGFPTDAQPPMLAMCTLAEGTSVFIENIFNNRYKYVDELCRLGAKVRVDGRMAVVEGVHKLSGATVQATDLRGGAALIVAALAAEGTTTVEQVRHIDRGYADIEGTLAKLGAQIRREREETA